MKDSLSTKLITKLAGIMILAGAGYVIAGLFYKVEEHDYIAHGGGSIDGHNITNTLEAVENAIAHGVKYIELDLQLTSDGRLVATHEWDSFAEHIGRSVSPESPPTYDEFSHSVVLGQYTPMTYEVIDSVFASNPQLVLVTDKIRDVSAVKKYLGNIDPQRVIMECFSRQQYDECVAAGYTPMRSYNNLMPGGVNVVGDPSLRYSYLHFVPTALAVYDITRLSTADADSLFAADQRIRFIYVDYL